MFWVQSGWRFLVPDSVGLKLQLCQWPQWPSLSPTASDTTTIVWANRTAQLGRSTQPYNQMTDDVMRNEWVTVSELTAGGFWYFMHSKWTILRWEVGSSLLCWLLAVLLLRLHLLSRHMYAYTHTSHAQQVNNTVMRNGAHLNNSHCGHLRQRQAMCGTHSNNLDCGHLGQRLPSQPDVRKFNTRHTVLSSKIFMPHSTDNL